MDGGNKTQRLYRYDCNYVLSKLIVDNGLKDLWIDRIYRVYTDIEIANNTKINHIMISFTDPFLLNYKEFAFFIKNTQKTFFSKRLVGMHQFSISRECSVISIINRKNIF